MPNISNKIGFTLFYLKRRSCPSTSIHGDLLTGRPPDGEKNIVNSRHCNINVTFFQIPLHSSVVHTSAEYLSCIYVSACFCIFIYNSRTIAIKLTTINWYFKNCVNEIIWELIIKPCKKDCFLSYRWLWVLHFANVCVFIIFVFRIL